MAKYRNPRAFKQALTDRIKRRAKARGMLFNRYRQLVLFDRFLARVYEACGEAVVLKGGYVMELRLGRARTTKDVDMRGTGDIDDLLGRIAEEAKKEGSDFLTFDVADVQDMEEMVGEQVIYEGRRVRVQAKLGGQIYGEPFGLDLSMADALALPPDSLPGDDLFEFMDLEPLQHRVYPREAHIAEKLHAISQKFSDGRINSRAKDLVDVGLLASNFDFNAGDLFASIEATFEFRNTHAIPDLVPQLPPGWDTLYDKIRQTDELDWRDVDELHQVVTIFLNPVLADGRDAGRYKLFGVVTNIDRDDKSGAEVIRWHRERCGKSEEAHAIMTSDLAGGQFPSGLFGANAAWWQIMLVAFNLHAIMERHVLSDDWQVRRMKHVRFALIRLPARVIHSGRRTIIRVPRDHPSLPAIIAARDRMLQMSTGPRRGPNSYSIWWPRPVAKHDDIIQWVGPTEGRLAPGMTVGFGLFDRGAFVSPGTSLMFGIDADGKTIWQEVPGECSEPPPAGLTGIAAVDLETLAASCAADAGSSRHNDMMAFLDGDAASAEAAICH